MPRKLHAALVLTVAVLAFAPLAPAQIFSLNDSVPVTGPTVTERRSGIVLDSVTGQPVSRVLVTAPGRNFAALTDYQGRFQFDLTRLAEAAQSGANFPPIVFQMRKPGYLDSPAFATVPYTASDAVPPPLQLHIVPAAVVTGHVYFDPGNLPYSDTGGPPPAHYAILFHREVDQGVARWNQAQQAQLNSHGEFRFPDLHAGDYKIASPGWNMQEGKPQSAPPSVPALLPAYYPNAGDLDSAAVIHIRPGETVNADLTLRGAALYEVTIPVLLPNAAGRQLNGVHPVFLHEPLGIGLAYDSRQRVLRGYLPPGSYDLRILGQGPAFASASVQFTVGGGAVRLAPVTLHPAAVVPVNVHWDPSTAAPPDAATRQYGVNVRPLDAGGIANMSPRTRTGDGTTVTLTEGLYRFLMDAAGGYIASATSGTTDLLREPLRVGPGETPQPIEVTLRNDPATLQVTLQSSAALAAAAADSSQPVQLYAVSCIPLDEPMRQELMQFGVAGATLQGGISMSLAPGRYLVLGTRLDQGEPSLPEFRNPEVLQRLTSSGVVVTLSAGEKRAVALPATAMGAQ